MALITFEDLPSTNTPINASNLNNNFSELTPVLLHSGASQNVTLSDDISNYKYIEITYGNDWLVCGSVKIPAQSTNLCFRVQNGYGSNLALNDNIGYYVINHNYIAQGNTDRSRYIEYSSSGNYTITRANNVFIWTVIGYK